MSIDSDDSNEVAGTANNNLQHRLYRQLCELYTPEGASFIASADLRRKGEDVEPADIAAWDRVTRLNHAGKMDLATASTVAATHVNALTDALMGRGNTTYPSAFQTLPTVSEVEEDEGWEDDETEADEDEYEGPVDFGYDSDDENAEHALDYIYKLNDM